MFVHKMCKIFSIRKPFFKKKKTNFFGHNTLFFVLASETEASTNSFAFNGGIHFGPRGKKKALWQKMELRESAYECFLKKEVLQMQV